jgi:acyl carrier protein
METIQAALIRFLQDEVGLRPDMYRADTPLFSSGLLDSFALVALLAFAETQFGVVLPAENITQANVDTIDGLAAYVAASMAEARE